MNMTVFPFDFETVRSGGGMRFSSEVDGSVGFVEKSEGRMTGRCGGGMFSLSGTSWRFEGEALGLASSGME